LFWFALAAVLLLAVGVIIGGYARAVGEPELPRCYLTTERTCADGYDYREMPGYMSMLHYAQCCREPHYVLQGIEPTLYTMTLVCADVNRTATAAWGAK
jgi:hypothetical protein